MSISVNRSKNFNLTTNLGDSELVAQGKTVEIKSVKFSCSTTAITLSVQCEDQAAVTSDVYQLHPLLPNSSVVDFAALLLPDGAKIRFSSSSPVGCSISYAEWEPDGSVSAGSKSVNISAIKTPILAPTGMDYYLQSVKLHSGASPGELTITHNDGQGTEVNLYDALPYEAYQYIPWTGDHVLSSGGEIAVQSTTPVAGYFSYWIQAAV